MTAALEALEADRVGVRAEQRSAKLIGRWQVWLLIARSQIEAARQCALRDQWARADNHRKQALALLEKIGLENLEVRGFDD